MVLGASYLLWMFQRLVTGDVSEFLHSLHDHLTDISPLEILTLVPLGILVVLFGVLPGLILEMVGAPIEAILGEMAQAVEIPLDPLLVAAGLGLVAFVIVVRAATLPGLRRRSATTGESAA
jgi:hypothetical protein